jgi:hypothetical protein
MLTPGYPVPLLRSQDSDQFSVPAPEGQATCPGCSCEVKSKWPLLAAAAPPPDGSQPDSARWGCCCGGCCGAWLQLLE